MNEHDDDVRLWAAEWLEPTLHPRAIRDWLDKSDADLAEAVRVKFADDEVSMADNGTGVPVWTEEARDAFQDWGGSGPLAFIADVRVIVEANK